MTSTWRLIPSTTSRCTHTGEDNNVLLPALEAINSGDLYVTHGGAEAVTEHVLKQPPLCFIGRYYAHSFPVGGILFVQGLVQFHNIQRLEEVKKINELVSWSLGKAVERLVGMVWKGCEECVRGIEGVKEKCGKDLETTKGQRKLKIRIRIRITKHQLY